MSSSPAPHHARPHILPQQLYFRIPEFLLESGEVFLDAQVAFTFRGLLNAERDNAIIICHGFTESADIEDWWSPMLERVNPALDSEKYSIICCNYLGSPFGSSSPLTYRPGQEGKTERYASQFPRTTFRDDVQIQMRVLNILGVRAISCVIGHGMGNIAALEWARLGQNYVRSMILLDTAGQQSSLRSVTPPDQQYFGASSSMALPSCFDEIDDRFRHGFDGERTTAISKQSSPRAIEFLHDRPDKPLGFDTDCYVHILDKIKSYNVALGRLSKSLDREEGLNEVLAQVKQPSLVIGIRAGDHLATAEKVLPYKQTPHVEFVLIEKEEGTNASLLEAEQLDALFHSFFQSVSAGTLGKDLDTQ